MENLVVSHEEAIKKGYLENKTVFLKPSPRAGKMIKDPSHVGYFMHEGASTRFVLPKNKRGELVQIFKNKEEQAFFESELGVDLSLHKKKDNFWNSFSVLFQKSPITMFEGSKFDLSNPTDNLRVRILKNCLEVAPNWEKRFSYPTYKYALVQEDYEENKAEEAALQQQKIWEFFGSINNSTTKMREFLGVYLASNKKTQTVGSDVTKAWLMKEISEVIKDKPEEYLAVVNDPHFPIKAFILEAVSVGAIEKEGVNKYSLPGDATSWQLIELVEYLEELKDNSDDLYLKIKAQITMKRKK